jgi:hypothetical protein
MKNISLTLVSLVLLSISMYAQKPQAGTIVYPVISPPADAAYGNSKTYDLYALGTGDELNRVFGGRHSVTLYGLKQDRLNGDFKMLVKLNRFAVSQASIANNTAVLKATATAQIFVYDKDGKEIYTNNLAVTTDSQKKNISSKQLSEADKNESSRAAFARRIALRKRGLYFHQECLLWIAAQWRLP